MNGRASRQSGFVLVVTVWILAAVTIGAAFVAQRVANSIALAEQSQQMTEVLVDMSSTRSEMLFRIATTEVSVYGLGPSPQQAIVLDDRRYRGTGGDVVRLQDSSGLINVNFVQPEILLRLLGQMGVAAEKRGPLLDTLNDYTDTDDLRRLNGAESAEYRARNLPPPPNDFLATPWQLEKIIGWRDEATLWKSREFLDTVTTARAIHFNPNTAPREALAALPGSSREIADNLIRLRNLIPLTKMSDLGPLANHPLFDSESVVFFPGNTFRMTQESDKMPTALRYQITLTPLGDQAPWRIDYYMTLGGRVDVQNANEPLPLPERVALAASKD